MTYEVETQVFNGPFDLLLHLILAEEVELYEISLATIVDSYLLELDRMEHLDLNVATEFLLIAATLVELKAADPKFPLHIHTGAATGGRGPCQQKGVDMAAGTADIILFLHADTELCASHRIIVSYPRALVIGASRVSSNMCLESVCRLSHSIAFPLYFLQEP